MANGNGNGNGHDDDKTPVDKADPIMQYFSYRHLRNELQEVSRPFYELAQVVAALPRNPERECALRKLLEAKDCAVRAKLYRTE